MLRKPLAAKRASSCCISFSTCLLCSVLPFGFASKFALSWFADAADCSCVCSEFFGASGILPVVQCRRFIIYVFTRVHASVHCTHMIMDISHEHKQTCHAYPFCLRHAVAVQTWPSGPADLSRFGGLSPELPCPRWPRSPCPCQCPVTKAVTQPEARNRSALCLTIALPAASAVFRSR